jgi:endoglucanase
MDKFLFDILNTPSPVGREVAGQQVWLDEISKYADLTDSDTYGSAWAVKRSNVNGIQINVMIEAHVDEIGMAVKYITKEGMIHIVPIGGSDPAIARGQRVRILGEDEIIGVVGNTAIHMRDLTDEKTPKWEEIVIDIGATSKEEVISWGVDVGTPIIYDTEPKMLGENIITGRALDNRIGGYVLTRVMKELADEEIDVNLVCLNAVHEEIGGFGATMATHRLKPDVAVCIDVTHATDTPGINHSKHGEVKLGAGPTLTYGTINHPVVTGKLEEAAKRVEVSVQREAISRGSGTDTDSIMATRSGIPSALMSFPLRYMHSPVETMDMRDIDGCVKVLADFIRNIDRKNFSVPLSHNNEE